MKTTNPEEFEKVAWRKIYNIPHNVSGLFQLGAYTHDMDVAGTYCIQAKRNMETVTHNAPSMTRRHKHTATCYTAMKQEGSTQCNTPLDDWTLGFERQGLSQRCTKAWPNMY